MTAKLRTQVTRLEQKLGATRPRPDWERHLPPYAIQRTYLLLDVISEESGVDRDQLFDPEPFPPEEVQRRIERAQATFAELLAPGALKQRRGSGAGTWECERSALREFVFGTPDRDRSRAILQSVRGWCRHGNWEVLLLILGWVHLDYEVEHRRRETHRRQ